MSRGAVSCWGENRKLPSRRIACVTCIGTMLLVMLLLAFFHLEHQVDSLSGYQQRGWRRACYHRNLTMERELNSLIPVGRLRVNPRYPLLSEGRPRPFDVDRFASLLKDYYKETMTVCRRQKGWRRVSRIVYVCDGSAVCGGWADRLRGITYLFYWALMTDSFFCIENWYPLDLLTLFPAVHSLDEPPRSWYQTLFRSAPPYTEFGSLLDDIKMTDLLTRFREVRMWTTNYEWRNVTDDPRVTHNGRKYGVDRLSVLDLFRVMVRIFLTRTSSHFGQRVNYYLERMGGEAVFKIGVQIRTGKDDVNECASRCCVCIDCASGAASMPRMLPRNHSTVFADAAVQACESRVMGRPCSIFVSADSSVAAGMFVDVVNRTRPGTAVVVSEGVATHIDHGFENVTRAVAEKTFLDWYLLTQMNYMLISRSGMGETAAWAANVPTKRVSGRIGGDFIDYDVEVGFPRSPTL